MTRPQIKHRQAVAHMTFETIVYPSGETTFALYVADMATNPRPLFSGHVTRGMGSDLRRLASHFDDLERNLKTKETA